MAPLRYAALWIALVPWPGSAAAIEPVFSGSWYQDLRTTLQQKQGLECGVAYFKLIQTGDKITGEHSVATAGCGRINEGGAGSVKGFVVGATAVLVVTSGRNGATVIGKATRRGSKLHWIAVDELSPGEGQGDSPLILHEGLLSPKK